jgi:hypothetical protein
MAFCKALTLTLFVQHLKLCKTNTLPTLFIAADNQSPFHSSDDIFISDCFVLRCAHCGVEGLQGAACWGKVTFLRISYPSKICVIHNVNSP